MANIPDMPRRDVKIKDFSRIAFGYTGTTSSIFLHPFKNRFLPHFVYSFDSHVQEKTSMDR